MRILYAIQATGNGHLAAARALLPLLKERGSVDILVSGSQAEICLPYPVTYQLKGLSFNFGKNGGIDYWNTFKNCKSFRFLRDMRQLPVKNYDLILSDFEPISAWAARLQHRACISISHQAAVLHPAAPKPANPDPIGRTVLKWYAPCISSIGFHYKSYAQGIFTPLIRKEVRDLPVEEGKHYTVYLPAYNDRFLFQFLTQFPGTKWQVFSKEARKPYHAGNIWFRPVHHDSFLKSLSGCAGILSGAGFQTTAEVLYLKKKLLAVPMRGQYEQQCNATALQTLGVNILPRLGPEHTLAIQKWMDAEIKLEMNFPDNAQQVVERIWESGMKTKAAPLFAI